MLLVLVALLEALLETELELMGSLDEEVIELLALLGTIFSPPKQRVRRMLSA